MLKKVILILIISVLCVAGLCSCETVSVKLPALFDDTLPEVEADENIHLSVSATGDPVIVYTPPSGGAGYRYGPSIIYYADGSCDAWFSCMGAVGEWDWISYRHSDDGMTFGDEKVVLVPNPDSMDFFSCCDPGVVYFGGYYYLGYTSTIFDGGVNNNVFVARSVNPDGPFEKWNGSGWGGDPQPIVYYNEDETRYGAGEPSMIVKGDKLYVYYSWICDHGEFLALSVADTSENWPATLEHKGIVYKKEGDSFDMFYLEENGKFYGIDVCERFSPRSGIRVIESDDGINFKAVDVVRENTYQFSHNAGIAHRPDGHIRMIDDVFVGYAFSDGADGNWGKWATAFQKVSFELYEGPVREIKTVKDEKGVKCDDYFVEADRIFPINVSSTQRTFNFLKHYTGENVSLIWFDQLGASHAIENAKDVTFYGYDKSIVEIDGFFLKVCGKTGETVVYFKYKGLVSSFKVRVYPTGDFLPGDYKKDIESFDPVQESFTVDVSDRHKYQIRGRVVFNNHTWAEAFNDGIMIDAKIYPVTFEVADPDVISVSRKGIITPMKAGKTGVTVTIAGEKSFTVQVEVMDRNG